MHAYIDQGFEFIELVAGYDLSGSPAGQDIASVPLIWQCPSDLPAEHESRLIRQAVLEVWREQLQAASAVNAALMILQFRQPDELHNKSVFIHRYIDLLQSITQETRAAGIQPVLRNSPDNRDQLQLLREIVRAVPGLALALDIAYAHHQVVKNLTGEYLWDSDLAPRLAHIYVSDTNGRDSSLRLPLGSVGNAAPDWSRLVRLIRERYNASVTIDAGSAAPEYLEQSRQKWLSWWAQQ